MIVNETNSERLFDLYKATDMEVALHLIRLMDAANKTEPDVYQKNMRKILTNFVEEAMKTLTNPFALDLLRKMVDDPEAVFWT